MWCHPKDPSVSPLQRISNGDAVAKAPRRACSGNNVTSPSLFEQEAVRQHSFSRDACLPPPTEHTRLPRQIFGVSGRTPHVISALPDRQPQGEGQGLSRWIGTVGPYHCGVVQAPLTVASNRMSQLLLVQHPLEETLIPPADPEVDVGAKLQVALCWRTEIPPDTTHVLRFFPRSCLRTIRATPLLVAFELPVCCNLRVNGAYFLQGSVVLGRLFFSLQGLC